MQFFIGQFPWHFLFIHWIHLYMPQTDIYCFWSINNHIIEQCCISNEALIYQASVNRARFVAYLTLTFHNSNTFRAVSMHRASVSHLSLLFNMNYLHPINYSGHLQSHYTFILISHHNSQLGAQCIFSKRMVIPWCRAKLWFIYTGVTA